MPRLLLSLASSLILAALTTASTGPVGSYLSEDANLMIANINKYLINENKDNTNARRMKSAVETKTGTSPSSSSTNINTSPLKAGPPGWPTDHHDLRNSNRGEYDGPADGEGVCRYTFYQYGGSPFLSETVDMYATGVTSITDENALLFGGTDNVFRIARLGFTVLDTWACDLSLFNNRTLYPSVTDYGLVSSGTTWQFVDSGNTYDRFAVSSADGSVYALNWEACALGVGGKQASSACNHTIDAVPLVQDSYGSTRNLRSSSADELFNKKRELLSIGGGPSCVQFVTALPSNKPSYSPTRYIPNTYTGGWKNGLLLVSTTDKNLDTGGTLYALDADNGTIAWTHTAMATINGTSTSIGIRGIAPAVDSTRNGLIYLAYGPRIVALNPITGAVVTSFQVSQKSSDGFVASPVISSDAKFLLLHSAVGTVWRIAITGGATPTFSVVFACDYTLDAYYAGNTNCSLTAERPPATLPIFNWDSETGARTVIGHRTINRDEFVSGGWYQLMTRTERDALFTELAQITGEVRLNEELTNDHIAIQHASRRASLLTTEQLDTIGMSQSHARLDGTGRPRWVSNKLAVKNNQPIKSGPEFTSTYPYATPAIGRNDEQFVITQFVAFGDGDTGLFVANSTSGAPVWLFAGIYGLIKIPFGRSRSTPTLDVDGGLYVGADVDWSNNDTLPLLFAWQEADPYKGPGGGYRLRWINNMGLSEKIIVGSSSAVVKLANSTQNELVMASGDGANGFREGIPCPTNNDAEPCSYNGKCNCYTGVCMCDSGFGGQDCSIRIPVEPNDNDLATGAAVMVGVTVGSLGAVVLLAIVVSIGKSYGFFGAAKAAASTLSGNASTYGSLSNAYDTRPLVSNDGGVSEGSSLLSKH